MSAHPKTPELSMSAMRSLAATPGSQFVPVALGELYGPMCCSGCGQESWTIWVTPEEKAEKTFMEIYQYEGEARCEKCGPPDAANSTEIEGRHQPLVLRLQSAVAHMAPHQRDRQNGQLIVECLEAVNKMEIRHAATMLHTQTIVDEANALREQMRENPWCAACREPDCCVSGDGTCAMIRKYLSSANA